MTISEKDKKEIWGRLKTALINFLESKFVTTSLVKILGSSAVGGIRAYIIKYVLKYLFTEVVDPLVRMFLRSGEYDYHYHEGKLIVKKIEEAKNENNQSNYDHAMDDLFK